MSDDFIAINDKLERFAKGLYAKWNGGERELDRGETKRECVRGRAFSKGRRNISTKFNILA